MLDVCGNCFIASALCLAWVHAGPAQVLRGFKRQYCLRGGEAAGPARAPRVSRGCPTQPSRPRGSISRCAGPTHRLGSTQFFARCGSIVWRGSTRVLEEARERV